MPQRDFYVPLPSCLFRREKRRLAGVDIGGTTVTAIVVDERWQLLADETVATDLSDNAATMASIAAGIRRAGGGRDDRP